MPKRELSKCREWERERRERLKTCFDALARLLPSHDPTINPSKLEILQRAATHITDLQQKNKELLLGDQRSTAVAQRDEVRRLRERVKKLHSRSEQLVNLLRTAGLKVPKECMGVVKATNGVFKGPPKLWSGRMTREKADSLRKQHENELKPSAETSVKIPVRHKRKRLSSISAPNKKSSENTPPPSKKSLKQSSSTNQTYKKSPKKHQRPPGALSTSSSSSIASKVATVLGPGTLILANGSVVPVPAPVGTPATLHRIQLVPTVTSSNQQVILMPQRNTTSNITKSVSKATTTKNTNTITNKLPILRPKMAGGLKQNVVAAKIAIPALPKRKIPKKAKNVVKTSTGNSTSVIATNNNKPSKNCKNGQNSKPVVENPTTDSSIKPDEIKVNPSEKPPENFEGPIAETIKENTKENAEVVPAEVPNKKDDDKQIIPEPPIEEPPKIINLSPLTKPDISENQLLHLPTSVEDHQVIEATPDDLPHQDDHSELSNDIFASLGNPGDSSGVIGGQHTESMSPTAAFLLAFPLVSTLTGNRISEQGGKMINSSSNNNNNERNDEERQGTPTTLLQIGGTMNLDSSNTKSNNRTVLQIEDAISIDTKETISIDVARQPKNLAENLKQTRNYDYFRQSQTYPNQQTTCLNREQNNRQHIQNSYGTENTREPLISSVLQVSHACLYEQRNTQHNLNNLYPNLPENYNYQAKDSTKIGQKNRKQQNQRAPVNWMTTPDIRPTFGTNEHQATAATSGMTSDYFLPPFSDVYSGISSGLNDLSHQNNNNGDQGFGWSSGTNRSVLPTLLGDLALGVTAGNNINPPNSVIYTNTSSVAMKSVTTTIANSNQYYQPFDSTTNGTQMGQIQNVPSNQPNHAIKDNPGTFLSVSSILVGGKPRKNHHGTSQPSQQNHQNHQQTQHNHHNQPQRRHREKSNKSSRATSSSNNHSGSDPTYQSNEAQNAHKKYGVGYSAEELIGEPQFHENRSNNYSLGLEQQSYHRTQNHLNHNHQPQQNNQHQQPSTRQNQGYQHRQQVPQQNQQGPFSATYTPHGEFSALLSAAVVDTYSKTFDSFVHVKPPTVAANGGPGGAAPTGGFDSYCATGRSDTTHRTAPTDTERRRHRSRTGGASMPRESLVAPSTVANTGGGFSELSFLSMTGAVNSPMLPDDFHASAPFLTNAPPPIPTPVASSLTNFNLSAIFPEIHKGASVSAASTPSVWPHSKPPASTARTQARYQHQNQQIHSNHHENPEQQHGTLTGSTKSTPGYCHSQQHHGQHEGLYGGVAPSQGFPGILGHHQVQGVGTTSNSDVTTAPTNFSFSFSTP